MDLIHFFLAQPDAAKWSRTEQDDASGQPSGELLSTILIYLAACIYAASTDYRNSFMMLNDVHVSGQSSVVQHVVAFHLHLSTEPVRLTHVFDN